MHLISGGRRLCRMVALMLFVGLVGLGVASGAPPAAAQAGRPVQEARSAPPAPEFVPGQVLVRFKGAVDSKRADKLLKARGMGRLRHIKPLRVELLNLPADLSVEQAVEALKGLPEVEFVEPNYILHIAEISDPGLAANQWAPQRIGAPQAWLAAEGDPAVVIAVVDTGSDYQHSELAPNIWANSDEIAGNGLDDDGNGYVDDVRGWDFVNSDADPMDDHFHGTHVAGIAAAAPSADPSGIVGICPRCQVMPVKVMDATGSGTMDKVASGITYAADNGARVINLSLGASLGATTLQDAVNYAWGKGALVVAAAGNNGADARLYPAAYPNALAVAASNANDYHSCFSNYGQGYVSVAAPGELIYSTTPRDASGNDTYATYSGTSMATPHVAGLAGLLFSQRPSRSNAEVRELIETTAEDLGQAGTDPYFGHGRINADRALRGDTSPTVPPSGGLVADDPTATGYPNARKLVRDAGGVLHLAWHGRSVGQYSILYSTSNDGAAWSAPQAVFASDAETYNPTLAVDGSTVYIAFPSKDGSGAYRILFMHKPLSGGAWSTPMPTMGGAYNAVRPDLYLDPANHRLHLASSSLDDAAYVYYAASDDGGQSWGPVQQVNVTTGAGQLTRYAAVHASGSEVYIAGRSVQFVIAGLISTYRLFTIRSLDGGVTWRDLTELVSYMGISSGERGASLAGAGERLYLAYENAGAIYFRRSDHGVNWSAAQSLGSGNWPSVTQGDDGQAWVAWESDGSLWLRRYSGASWLPADTVMAGSALGKGFYPNLKLGTGAGLVEWVATVCSGAPFRLLVDSRALTEIPASPPVQFAAADYGVQEDAGAATIAVTLGSASTYPVTVDYAMSNGTAVSGKDYTAGTGTLTFAPGETTKTFSVTIKNDTTDEPEQTVVLTLSNPTNAVLGAPAVATLTITDNDPPPSVTLSSSYVNESVGSATVTVRLSAASEYAVTVDYATSDGTATAGLDYSATGGTLTFTPGQTSVTFGVPIADDLLPEANETVKLTLSNPDNASLGASSTATLTLYDNDTLTFSTSYYTVKENAGAATITVRLNAASSLHVYVNYATGDGTATAGADYSATGGTLDFAPGETSQTFSVPIVDDLLSEPNETVKLTLSNPVNAALGSTSAATLTIYDNDTLNFSTSYYTVKENAGEATITVRLSAASSLTVYVDYATGDGTAIDGADYTADSKTLTFAPGETSKTFSVPIVDDLLSEPNETVKLTLSNPVNAGLGSTSTATLTIYDNDTLNFSTSYYTVKENAEAATITVKLNAASSLIVSVVYATVNGTATAGDDYTADSKTLTFAPGETSKTFSVPIVDDLLSEPNETIKLALSNPINAGLGSTSAATLTIYDNDTLTFSSSYYTVKENAGAATITVRLNAASSLPVSVSYATVTGGTATAGSDYTATGGTLAFAPGETSKTFSVTINDDLLKESSETIKLALSIPAYAGLGTPSSATITITDNDV